jgi:hypothetical protein
VTDSIRSINGGGLPSSLKEIIDLALTIAKGGLGNMIGSLINGNLGKLGATPPANALLNGEPTGYWHVTLGNPLNPIAMMGNMICSQVEMVMGEGLGYDDFPVNVSFNCQLTHGKPRDAGDIESMFNAGKGRIYQSPFLGSRDDSGVDLQATQKMKEIYKQIAGRRDVNHIGENVGRKTGDGNGYNSGDTQFPVLNNVIDQIVAYTR